MKKIIYFIVLIITLVSCYTVPEEILKSESDGSVKITCFADVVNQTALQSMMGFNMSYYHDKDSIWANDSIAQKLEGIHTKVLRYPGGAETSYFHWQSSGCPGYNDIWDTNGKFTATSVQNITDNMNTDEFIGWCRQIGAEPLLGINIKSGEAYNLQAQSLQEAKDWVQYCKDKGYNVKYWYLDNEVDNTTARTPITVARYAALITQYSTELKKIDPNIKIIISLLGNATSTNYQTIIGLAGAYIDIIDLHYYYSWNVIDFAIWSKQRPMISADSKLTYTSEINNLQSYISGSVNPNIQLVSLEWNMGPSSTLSVSIYQQALMQAEMFQQLVASKLQMACVWPLIWGIKNSSYPTVLNQQNYSTTPLYEIFKLYGTALGNNLCYSLSSDMRIVSQTIVSADKAWAFSINKSSYTLPVKFEVKNGAKYSKAKVTIISSDDINSATCKVSTQQVTIVNNLAEVTIPPYSFFCYEFSN